MGNQYYVILYVFSLVVSISLGTGVIDPLKITSPFWASILQILLLILFAKYGKIRKKEFLSTTELAGKEMAWHVLGTFIFMGIGIVLSVRGADNTFCLTGYTMGTMVQSRTYMLMKVLSVYPIMQIPSFLYFLRYRKFPRVNWDYYESLSKKKE